MSKAVIITENKYPLGDAGAIRQHSMAKIYKSLGYDVMVVGYGQHTGGAVKEYDGIRYTSLKARSNNKIIRLLYRLSFGFRAISYVKRHIKKPDLILVVDTLPYGWRLIEKYGVKNNIKLIHDSVEWYSPEEFANGESNLEYKLKEKTNTQIINKSWSVIAISSFLQKHFEGIAKSVIRVPVIMDTDTIEFSVEKEASTKTSFVYVGAPGRKDYLKEIVKGFTLLDDKYKSLCQLHIIGVTRQQLIESCQVDEADVNLLGDTLSAYGRLPHDEAISWVRKADYTLLLRDASLRYAMAGFPTKIVESLSCATPPVCNISSDLGDYLIDGENAIISESHNPEALKNALIRAIDCSTEQRKQMRASARKAAEENFDYKKYAEDFKKLQ